MKKISKKQRGVTATQSKPERSGGFGSGRPVQPLLHVVRPEEKWMEEGRIQSSEQLLEKHFGGEPRMRIALEAGTHSPWVSRLLNRYGHQVIVANPRKIPTITASETKNDRNDAEQLARFAAFDPKLLPPDRAPQPKAPAGPEPDPCAHHAGAGADHDRQFALRGLVKSAGGRLPACPPNRSRRRRRRPMPPALKAACYTSAGADRADEPAHRRMDKQIEKLAKKISGDRYPAHRARRRTARGRLLCAHAGPAGNDGNQPPGRRLLGLRPAAEPVGRLATRNAAISKTGNSYLRSLLVQSAQYILGRFGPDSDCAAGA